MSLPKIDYPILTLKIPSTKKGHKFRPFLVKEEKLLLMAKESGLPGDVLQAIKQVVNNCCIDDKFDIDSLTIFDLEYLFLKLRAASVDNTVKVSYKDLEDEQTYDFEINLDEIDVVFPEHQISNRIEINDHSGIIMKYPSAALYDDTELLNADKEYLFELIVRCIDKIYNNDEVFEVKDHPRGEIRMFLESLSVKTFEKVSDFLTKLPSLKHTIKYKNSLGHDRTIELTSLSDFFTF